MVNNKKSKFVFSETFNNSDGKTSGSGFVGVLLGLIAGLGFICGILGWFFKLDDVMEFLDRVLNLGMLSAVLMGVRKATGIFDKKNIKEEEN